MANLSKKILRKVSFYMKILFTRNKDSYNVPCYEFLSKNQPNYTLALSIIVNSIYYSSAKRKMVSLVSTNHKSTFVMN